MSGSVTKDAATCAVATQMVAPPVRCRGSSAANARGMYGILRIYEGDQARRDCRRRRLGQCWRVPASAKRASFFVAWARKKSPAGRKSKPCFTSLVAFKQMRVERGINTTVRVGLPKGMSETSARGRFEQRALLRHQTLRAPPPPPFDAPPPPSPQRRCGAARRHTHGKVPHSPRVARVLIRVQERQAQKRAACRSRHRRHSAKAGIRAGRQVAASEMASYTRSSGRTRATYKRRRSWVRPSPSFPLQTLFSRRQAWPGRPLV